MLVTKIQSIKNKHTFFLNDVLVYFVDLFIRLMQNIILIASFVIRIQKLKKFLLSEDSTVSCLECTGIVCMRPYKNCTILFGLQNTN